MRCSRSRSARAQPAPRKPFDPHDWHDERYQRPAASGARAAPSAGPGSTPHDQHHGAAQPGYRHDQGTTQPAQQHGRSAPSPADQHGQHATPAGPSGGHGTPVDWKFTLPKTGDAARGRDVFTKLECFACHDVKGQNFPGVRDGGTIGPELSRMAEHHDAEFVAEAIVNSSAVIDEPQWRASDGTSKMPSFNDLISVQELVDLVAFLKSLAPSAGSTSEHKH